MNRFLWAVATVAVLAGGCASRGTVSRLESDIASLRLTLVATRKAQDIIAHDLGEARNGVTGLDRHVGDLRARLDAAAAEAADLRARIAQAEDAIRQARQAMEALARPAAPDTARPPAPAPRARPAPPRRSTPEEQYAAALATYRKREHGQAVLDFLDFIARHPAHPLAANAQYWIGEAYFAQRDYRQALAEFQQVLAMGTGKRPDALVMIGLCFERLHEPGRARATWKRVVREFPASPMAAKARALLARAPARAD